MKIAENGGGTPKTKNTLGDLNNHLFEQLERLNDEDLSDDDLHKEIQRAKAMTGLSSQIIANGNLALRAKEFVADRAIGSDDAKKMPPMLKAEFLRE